MKLLPLLTLTCLLGQQLNAADASLDKVKKAGKLRIACDMSYPPMEFEEKGSFQGFGIDFSNEVANFSDLEPSPSLLLIRPTTPSACSN